MPTYRGVGDVAPGVQIEEPALAVRLQRLDWTDWTEEQLVGLRGTRVAVNPKSIALDTGVKVHNVAIGTCQIADLQLFWVNINGQAAGVKRAHVKIA